MESKLSVIRVAFIAIVCCAVLVYGCTVKWEIESGKIQTRQRERDGVSRDPLADARAFGFQVTLPDELIENGWHLKGAISSKIERWWSNKRVFLYRRFMFGIRDPNLRRVMFSRFSIAVYAADPSWVSISDFRESVEDPAQKAKSGKYTITDTTINGISAQAFRLREKIGVKYPELELIVLLQQPFLYRILNKGDTPYLEDEFSRIINTFEFVPSTRKRSPTN